MAILLSFCIVCCSQLRFVSFPADIWSILYKHNIIFYLCRWLLMAHLSTMIRVLTLLRLFSEPFRVRFVVIFFFVNLFVIIWHLSWFSILEFVCRDAFWRQSIARSLRCLVHAAWCSFWCLIGVHQAWDVFLECLQFYIVWSWRHFKLVVVIVVSVSTRLLSLNPLTLYLVLRTLLLFVTLGLLQVLLGASKVGIMLVFMRQVTVKGVHSWHLTELVKLRVKCQCRMVVGMGNWDPYLLGHL